MTFNGITSLFGTVLKNPSKNNYFFMAFTGITSLWSIVNKIHFKIVILNRIFLSMKQLFQDELLLMYHFAERPHLLYSLHSVHIRII